MKHNKVCTSKGMRDRRIRLSANTAIQFYDVQDRLGYDRPSNAIDWLMKEAKVAIDSLDSDPLPSTRSTIFNPSEAFHRTPCDHRTSSFNNQPFGLMNLINRYQTEGGGQNQVIVPQETNLISAPLDFIGNPNYNTEEGFVSVLREPLQSSFLHPISHTSDNEFTNDNVLMGFSFQKEIQVQEDED